MHHPLALLPWLRPMIGAACLSLAAAVPALAVDRPGTDEPVQPIVAPKVKSQALVDLGKKLFFDPRLSRSGFISCNSCHNLSMGGADNLKTSIGDKWQQGSLNAPTVLNSSMNLAQFWDGRAKDLQAQAAGPITNPGEMAFTHELALDVLSSIPAYQAEFLDVFDRGPIDMDQVTRAIAAFEETLVTPNARFDRWLRGDTRALSKDEVAGYKLFKTSGCTACHNGPALGGNSFRKMGVVEPYKASSPAEGRYAVTGKDADRFNFKVPTLRNVALTHPYFHDGEASTLTEAVDIMGRLQLGKRFSAIENAQIVAFLRSLTGEMPTLTLPVLPHSTDATPQPHPFN